LSFLPEEDMANPLRNITLTTTSERIFQEIKQNEEKEKKIKKDKEEEAEKSGQSVKPAPVLLKPSEYLATDSAAFTSSSFTPKPIVDMGFTPKKTDKKGYVTIETNIGNLNLQLHCDLAPLACENFLTLCERKYYLGTIFHRNIRHFMIQGGDPTATGRGGDSIWGKDFPDEFDATLKHDGVGVVSMANRGKNTNTSQFFITYKSAPHLNNKHTVFGTLVGGMDLLKQLALIEVDDNDRPLQDIRIIDTIVFMNPFSEEEMKKSAEEQQQKLKKEKERYTYGSWLSNPQPTKTPVAGKADTVGKYITSTIINQNKKRPLDFGVVTQVAKKKNKNCIGWLWRFFKICLKMEQNSKIVV